MKVFTYRQYIKCIHTLRLNAVLQLAEENAEYKLKKQEDNYSHDKLIKNLFEDKTEAAKFINKFLQPKEKVKPEELEKYKSSYITKQFKSKEADIVYKLKDKEIFFLIEHQSSVDYSMPYRILNYCIDIMREWSNNKKIGQRTYYPIIIPTVIYTGSKKWKVPKNFKEKQIGTYILERYKIDSEYNFIDINKLSKQYLLENKSLFGYIMLLEKSQNKEELIENLNIIINSNNDIEQLDVFIRIIDYLLKDVLTEKTKKELIEKINRKGGGADMSTLRERLLAENRRLIKQGKMEGKIEGKIESQIAIVTNMLKQKIDEKLILKTTQIEKSKLEEIKKKLAVENN